MPAYRWGLTAPFTQVPLARHADLFRRVEAAGFDDVWTGETTGPDAFTPLTVAASATTTLRLGTGVVNPYTRGPVVLAQHAAALADVSEGRFVLGLGASSNVIVEQWNGVPFEKPLSRVRQAVEQVRPVLSGDRGPGGFRLDPAPSHEVPVVLAALRGKMLQLAAEVADGAFTIWLPASGARQVAETFAAPDKELICRFFCVPGPEDEALAIAKRMFCSYATVPVYTAYYRWLGLGERIDPVAEAWHAGDRARALELIDDDLIREIFLLGPEQQMAERLEAFAEAGITTFVLTPVTTPVDLPRMLDALAAARR